MKTIWFDMDGTIADFYSVEGWLDYLHMSDVTPYRICKPRFNFSIFARELHKVQANGYRIGIISWTSKSGTSEFNQRVAEEKILWLETHLPSVEWDEIHIVEYGTPKSTVVEDATGWLFDDEEANRDEWGEKAFDENDILKILKGFC